MQKSPTFRLPWIQCWTQKLHRKTPSPALIQNIPDKVHPKVQVLQTSQIKLYLVEQIHHRTRTNEIESIAILMINEINAIN